MFLESAFLWGLGAVSVPVVIHMLQSPTARIIDFPCIRFLKACQKRATRRTRLKNIILMLLRMAIIALIALGMAKPWREKEHTEVFPDSPVSMVIVLDNSYSMGFLDKRRSRFDQAREAAIGLIDTLKPGDEVAVLLMNEQAVPLLREFTIDQERAKTVLREAKLSVLGTNVDAAVREAIRLADKAGSGILEAVAQQGASKEAHKVPYDPEKEKRRRREIHILTDLQAESSEGCKAWDPFIKSGFLKNADTKARIYVTSFGRKGSPNCFIESAAVASGGPEQCTLNAQVWAVGAGSPGNVVTLNVDGKAETQETFAARPGAPATVPLTAKLSQAGTYRCTLALQDDGLPLDDRYHFTIEVGERSAVLVVDGDPSAIGPLSETFYLANALNPGGTAGAEGAPPVNARILSLAELPGTKLEDYKVVLLCNAPALDGAELVRLENFLREGGGLLVFLGNKANVQSYNPWSFLPISLTQPVGDPARKKSFDFGEQKDHPLFKAKLDLRSARFFECMGSDRATLKKDATILMSFANGQPALVEGRFGKGKVFLFTSSCDIEWNNFPLRRAYLPFLHHMIYYLSSQDTKLNSFRLKEPVKFQALAAHYNKEILITDPSGKEHRRRADMKGGYAECLFEETKQPGMYKVVADKAFTNSGGFGVNLDVRESAIDMADPEKVTAAGPSGLITFVDGPKRSVVEEIKRSREGEELWHALFKIALLVFIIESVFGNLISRAKRPEGAKFPLFEVLRQRNPGVAQ
jgi:hypothetical protein